MFKSTRTIVLTAITLLAAATASNAATYLQLFDATAPSDTVAVQAGGNFTVTMRLSTDASIAGFSAYLKDPSYVSGPANFTIASRSYLATNPFLSGDRTTSDSTLANTALNAKTLDFGYVGDPAANGIYDLMQIKFNVAAALTPGQYYVDFNAASILVDPDYNPAALDSSAVYTVNVTAAPEPASLALFSLLSAGLLARRRR